MASNTLTDQTRSQQASGSAASGTRLISLDAFRGFTMFWIVGGKSLMMAFRNLDSNVIAATIAYQLTHSPWEGIRFYDVIWPAFMLMVGVSVPFSFAKRRQTHTLWQIRLQAIKRSVILFLLGSLRVSVSSNTPTLIELSSALQPIAVAYLVASFLANASRRVQAAVGVLILVAYGLALHFISAPGVQAGSYAIENNLVRAVDLWTIGRTHQEGWGTVLSTLPTISTTILGLLLGQFLMGGASVRRKAAVIGITGVACVLAGLALSLVVPVIMKLWTVSYGVLSAGWACLQFFLFFWIIEVWGWRKWAFPFVVIGMNAITIYMGVTLVPITRIVGIFSKPLAAQMGAFGPLFNASAVILVEWLILYWMYKRKIFLRA